MPQLGCLLTAHLNHSSVAEKQLRHYSLLSEAQQTVSPAVCTIRISNL